MRRILACAVLLWLWAAAPAFAAFPTVAGSCASTDTVSDTSHTIDLDCTGQFGTIASGDLLIACWHGSAADATPNSALTGWTLLRDVVEGASNGHFVCFYKIATGSEGTSVSGSTDLSERTGNVAYRITSWHGTTPPEASAGRSDASGGEAGASPNPDSLNPAGWDVEDTLWIAVAGADGASVDFTAYPANYSSNQLETGNSGEGRASGATLEQGSASSEDPGTFTTTNGINRWGAMTIAVRPSAASATRPPCCLVGVF